MDNKSYHSTVFISLIIGVLNELVAYFTSVWIYHPWWMTFINLVVMFGLVMPLVAFFIRGYWRIFIVGFIVGLIYEFSDQYYLHWTSFPDNQFLLLNNLNVIRIAIAGLWGIVPTLTRWLVDRRLAK